MSFGWVSKRINHFCILILMLCSMLFPWTLRAEDNLISIDFVDADIHDVIRVLAAAKDFNFVVGPQVAGVVTLKLKDVSLETALDAVVNSNGFRYRIKDNFLKVDTAQKFAEEDQVKLDALSQEQLLTIVFEIRYINGNDVLELLKTQLTPRGKIIPVSSTISGGYTPASMTAASTGLTQGTRAASKPAEAIDRLIVIDTVQGITLVKKLLDELDLMPLQILIESKLVESQVDTQSDIGVRWDFLGGGADGTGGFKLGMSKVKRDFTEGYTRTKNDNLSFNDTGVNTRLKDSQIENVGTDTNTSTTTTVIPNIGPRTDDIDAEDLDENVLTTTLKNGDTALDTQTTTLALANNVARTAGRLTAATFSASDFDLVLNALKTKGGIEVISNPSIMTVNNHEASILVGERYPILKATTSDTGTVTQSFDHYEPVGVQLQVLPRVMDGDFVSMLIRPSVTSIGSTIGSPELQINRINTREASTELIVKSGDTIVIGGLISDQHKNAGSELPFLGKIPIIGKLFSYNHKTQNKVNLVVFVTPTVVRDAKKREQE